MLSSEHRASRGHANNILGMRTVIGNAAGAQRVNRGGARNHSAVATKRVVTLLIGGDEQNLATHLQLSIEHIFEFL